MPADDVRLDELRCWFNRRGIEYLGEVDERFNVRLGKRIIAPVCLGDGRYDDTASGEGNQRVSPCQFHVCLYVATILNVGSGRSHVRGHTGCSHRLGSKRDVQCSDSEETQG